jgi:hypothetical protein
LSQEQRDNVLVDGIKLSSVERLEKGSRFIPEEVPTAAEPDPEALQQLVMELKLEASQEVPSDGNIEKELETILQSQEYLREAPVRVWLVCKSESNLNFMLQEEWDCETILSTYSTLDNHPSLIKVRCFHF